jgi:hypothetical protein
MLFLAIVPQKFKEDSMNDPSSEQPPNAVEQITQINNKLNQTKEILEAPEWSQEIYNRVTGLQSEIRGTIIAIFSNLTATTQQRKQAQGELLKESNRLDVATNKRHKQYAFALQKQQRAKTDEDEDVPTD